MTVDKLIVGFCSLVSFALPLFGVAILVGYFFSYWSWLPSVGFAFFFLSIGLNVLALIGVSVLAFRRRSNPTNELLSKLDLRRKIKALLLAYPFGFLCLLAGQALMGRCLIQVTNRMPTAIEDVILTYSGETVKLGTFRPGESKSQSILVTRETSIQMQVPSLNRETLVLGYVAAGHGQNADVVISESGELLVEPE